MQWHNRYDTYELDKKDERVDFLLGLRGAEIFKNSKVDFLRLKKSESKYTITQRCILHVCKISL